MTKLSDMQLVLLSTAATRADGSLLPPPATLGTRIDRIHRSVQALVAKALAAEEKVDDEERCWRREDTGLVGVVITDAGRATIGVDAVVPPVATPAVREAAPAAPAATKIASVLTLLSRSDGATLAELVAATGWLPHTTRAALTGLRKKGHAIERGKRGNDSCYTIARVAA